MLIRRELMRYRNHSCFFFQAEDGIRDHCVTGVQTCALPISRNSVPFNNLAVIYNELGQFDNALQNAKHAVELDPDMLSGYGQVLAAYAGLNRIDEARAILNAAFQRKGSTTSFHVYLAALDWCEGKDAEMEKELESASATPDGELTALQFRASLAGARGQVRKAREFARQDEDALDRLHLQGRADVEAQLGALEALVGNRAEANSAA